MLTFIVLPHWSIMPQTLDIMPHPVTLSWHWVVQSKLYSDRLSAKRGAASTIFNDFDMSWPGIEPVTSRSWSVHSTDWAIGAGQNKIDYVLILNDYYSVYDKMY